jgi:hypothetical protein
VVTWNPSKVQLGVRFPLDAYFAVNHFFLLHLRDIHVYE